MLRVITAIVITILSNSCVLAFESALNTNSIEQALNKLIAHDQARTMGIQLSLYKDGEVQYSTAVGYANYETKEPLTAEHKVRYASVSKLFVALGIQKLVEQGKLSLAAPASDYLGFELVNPNYPDEVIKVSDLVNHLSSVRDDRNYVMPYPNHISEFFNPVSTHYVDGAHWANNRAQAQKPGVYFYYSNLGYGLLGSIIENVTKERFDVWMRANVLQPLAINGSYNIRDLKDDSLSNLYRYEDNQWRLTLDDQLNSAAKNPYPDYVIGSNGSLFSPQGGMRASSAELAKAMSWFLGQSSDGPITSDSLSLMEKQYWLYDSKNNNGDNYDNLFLSFGLGIQCTQDVAMGDRVSPQGGVKLCGHLGEAYGLLSGFLYDRDNDWGVVYAITGTSNNSDSLGEYSAFFLWEEAILSAVIKAVQ